MDIQSSSTFDKTAKGRHSKEDTSSSKESILHSIIDEKASETQPNLTMGDLEVDLGDKKKSHEKIRTARKESSSSYRKKLIRKIARGIGILTTRLLPLALPKNEIFH